MTECQDKLSGNIENWQKAEAQEEGVSTDAQITGAENQLLVATEGASGGDRTQMNEPPSMSTVSLADAEFQRRLYAQAELISGLQRSVLEFQERIQNMDANSDLLLVQTIVDVDTIQAETTGENLTVADNGTHGRHEDRSKFERLKEANSVLADKINFLRRMNNSLVSDILRLGIEWQQWIEEFKEHSLKCKNDRETYVCHLRHDHWRFVELWRLVQQLRREFGNARSLTFRNLSTFGGELRRMSKQAFVACQRLNMTYLRTVVSQGIMAQGARTEGIQVDDQVVAQRLSDSSAPVIASISISSDPSTVEKIEKLESDKQKLRALLADKNKTLQTLSFKIESAEQFFSECRALASAIMKMATDGNITSDFESEQTCSSDARSEVRLALRTAFQIAQHQSKFSESAEHRLKTAQDDAADSRQKLEQAVSRYSVLENDLQKLQAKITMLEHENDTATSELRKCESVQEVNTKQLERLKEVEACHAQQKLNLQQKQVELEKACYDRSLAEDRLNALSEENKRVTAELDQRRATCDKLTKDVAAMALQKDSLQIEVDRLSRELASAKDSNKSLELELRNGDRRFKLLTEDFEKIREANAADGLERHVQELARQKDSLFTLVDELKGKVEQLTDEKVTCAKSRQLIERLLNESRAENEAQADKISSLNKQLEAKAKLQDKLQVQRKKCDDQVSELRKKLELYHQTNAAQEDNLKSVFKELEDCQVNLVVARGELGALQREKKSLSSELRNMKIELSTLRNEMEQRVTEKTEMEMSLQQLQRTCEVTMEENELLKQSLNDARNENTLSEEKNSSMQALLVAQDETIRKREMDCLNLSSRIANLQKRIATYEEQISDGQRTIDHLQEQIKAVADEKLALKESLSSLQSQHGSLRLRTEVLDADKRDLQQKLDDSSAKLKEAEELIKRANDESHILNDRLKATQKLEDGLKEMISQTQKTLDDKIALTENLNKQLTVSKARETELIERCELEAQIRKELTEAKSVALERASYLEEQCRQHEANVDETEAQMQALSKVLSITQETERELKQKLEQASSDKHKTQERLQQLQEEVMKLESMKRSQEIVQKKCERKNAFLTVSLSEVKDERNRLAKVVDSMNKDRAALDKAISMIEMENMELHNAVQRLQKQLALLESSHSQKLIEVIKNNRAEVSALERRLDEERRNVSTLRNKLRNADAKFRNETSIMHQRLLRALGNSVVSTDTPRPRLTARANVRGGTAVEMTLADARLSPTLNHVAEQANGFRSAAVFDRDGSPTSELS